jgi:hypothetical protein
VFEDLAFTQYTFGTWTVFVQCGLTSPSSDLVDIRPPSSHAVQLVSPAEPGDVSTTASAQLHFNAAATSTTRIIQVTDNATGMTLTISRSRVSGGCAVVGTASWSTS